MKLFVKIVALLGLFIGLSACGGKPQMKSYTGVLPQTGQQVALTRITVPDTEGVTTAKVVELNGKLVQLETIDESTTTAQDYGQTALAAAAGPVINWAAARDIQSHKCNGDKCGRNAQQVVVQNVLTSESSAGAQVQQTGTGGGCPYCTGKGY